MLIAVHLRSPNGERFHSTWRGDRLAIAQDLLNGTLRPFGGGAACAPRALAVLEIEMYSDETYLLRDVDDRKPRHRSRIHLNGRHLQPLARVIARVGDVIRIDEWTVRIGHERLGTTTAQEAQFLGAICENPQDDAHREVYADWLEEHGRLAAAELLRLQSQIRKLDAEDPALSILTTQLRSAARDVNDEWRYLVALPPIEMCKPGGTDQTSGTSGSEDDDELRFDVECPKLWERLTKTSDENVRHCGACEKDVTYCTTISQALTVGRDGGCVALDPIVNRSNRDLDLNPPINALTRMGQVIVWSKKTD